MTSIDLPRITELLTSRAQQGREYLFEHECYELLSLMGAEAPPAVRLIPPGSRPTPGDLAALPTDKVVLKVVSKHITHKTEARGIRIVANEIGAVEAAFDLMLREVPEAYAEYLSAHPTLVPTDLREAGGANLEATLAQSIHGILLCSFVRPDASGFATELFVGIRNTAEFGPIISAGLGGVEMEILAQQIRPGAAVAIAPTGTIDGAGFLQLFRTTLSYQRLAGAMRGSRVLVSDAALCQCFQSFITIANHFSLVNPEAALHLNELEVNPFAISGARLAPVDGVCSFTTATAAPHPRPLDKIGRLLRPQTAAIIGVSRTSMNMGRIILNNLLDAGFDRDRTHVIRDGAEEIDGVRCVPSVAELPVKVDLVVVAVGADQASGVAQQLIEHNKAHTVILIPGGLGEKQGTQKLERQLKDRIAASHDLPDPGPVFLGGNSLGVISHPGRYNTMFIPQSRLARSRGTKTRRVCFMSQSGAFIIANLSRMPWLDPAYAVSIGNQIDLTAGDLLSYLQDDPGIEVFAIYLEGFQLGDGLVFANAVRQAVDQGKDVVFYKAGRTSEGRCATAGHTASVAGDYAVCASALTQAGAWVAEDFDDFGDALRLVVRLRGKRLGGNGLAALSNAGFESVGMADSIKRVGAELRLVEYTNQTRSLLEQALTRHHLDTLVDVKNPFDVTPMASDEAYAELATALLADAAVDLVVVGAVPLSPALHTLPPDHDSTASIDNAASIARVLPQVAAAQAKPVVAVVDAGTLYDPFAAQLEAGGLPVFRCADRAVRALGKLVALKTRQP